MADNAPTVKLPPVQQIGIIVKDVDKAVDYFSSLFGWGPFDVVTFENKGVTIRGKKADCTLKIAFAHSGPMEIEIIQVLDGETPHTDFLRKRGEGIQHLRFEVDNFEDIMIRLGREGIQPAFNHSYPEFGIHFAYLDTEADLGYMIELIQTGTAKQ